MQPRGPSGTSLPGDLGTAHLEALPLAALAVDRDGTVHFANAAAAGLLGRRREELAGTSLLSELFDDAVRGAAQEVLRQALGGDSWYGELMIHPAGAALTPAQLSWSPLLAGETVTGALVIVQPHPATGPRSAETTRVGNRLTRLARVAAELVMADDVEAVTKIVISHAADAAGATVASLSLRIDADTLALQGLRGGPQGAADRWATYPISAATPVGEAVRTGQQVLMVGNDEIRRRYPDLESAATGERTMICLPLKILARTIGAISLSFPGLRRLGADELEFLGILADICAQALDRIKAVSEATDNAIKLEFLAEASSILGSSLDYQSTLKSVARLGVPAFADWCSIALLEDGELRTLAVAHLDPDKVAMAEELQRRYPPDPDAEQGNYQVVRTGRSELVPDITDEMLVAATRDEEHLRLARELNLRSALSVPLTARGKTLGVITWVSGDGGRRFSAADLSFGEDLARRAATAIDNAALHSETLEAAVRLQRAVLPDTLPDLPRWQIAAHYSPAGRTDVGGDFYDVIALPDGRVALFVGDVMGRGVAAAAAMATIRAGIRAYVATDPEPGPVMHKLDVMFAMYDISRLVTVVYAVIDPVAHELCLANAGHPPPLVLHADGEVEQMPTGRDGPLGLGPDVRRPHRTPFEAGDTLLAFTDGLIERRHEDIDVGQRRLVEHCGLLAGTDLDQRLDRLVAEVRDHTRDDDIAALAVRFLG